MKATIETVNRVQVELAILWSVIQGGIHSLEIGCGDEVVTLALIEQYERVHQRVTELIQQVQLELPLQN